MTNFLPFPDISQPVNVSLAGLSVSVSIPTPPPPVALLLTLLFLYLYTEILGCIAPLLNTLFIGRDISSPSWHILKDLYQQN